MVLRSVIGALVAVGVMGAIAAALPERNAGRPVAAPKAQTFGTLPAPSTPAAATGDTTLGHDEPESSADPRFGAADAGHDAPQDRTAQAVGTSPGPTGSPGTTSCAGCPGA